MKKLLTDQLFTLLAMLPLVALVAAVALFAPGRPAPAHADETGIWADCGLSRSTWIPGVFTGEDTRPDEGDFYKAVIYTDWFTNANQKKHGWTDRLIRGHWYTVAGTADASDYVDLLGVYQEGRGRLIGEFPTIQDGYAEDHETFTIKFVNAAPGGEDAECTITIRDYDIGVRKAFIASTPWSGGIYRFGEYIRLSLEFRDFAYEHVYELDNDVQLGFRIGDEDGNSWRTAGYRVGSGTSRLTFNYQVRPGDLDLDGISMDGGYVDENGTVHGFGGTGRITRKNGDPLNPWFRGFGDQFDHRVDGRVYATYTEIISTPANGDTYGVGENIEIALTYTNVVDVAGHKVIGLRMGTGDWWRAATYNRGSGSKTLVYRYQVQPGDMDANGISIDGGYTDENGVRHGYGGDGTIKAAGTDVVAQHNYPGLSHNAAHKVDGRPYVTGVSITSTPASGRIYAASENIEITMAFDQAVDVEGDKIVGMRMGTGADWWRGVWYNRGSGTDTLVFSYQVQPGDFDDNGISMDGGFTDSNGTTHGFGGSGAIVAADTDVAVNPHYPRLPHNSDHQVDGVAPTISAVSIIPKAGSDNTYGVGDLIEVYVTFDELVLIVGTPQMTLDFDGTEKTAAYTAPQAAAAIPSTSTGPAPYRFANFTYTVRVGDTDADGIAIAANALALNGGSIRDTAGNNAVLSHAALAADAKHMVSAPGGL